MAKTLTENKTPARKPAKKSTTKKRPTERQSAADKYPPGGDVIVPNDAETIAFVRGLMARGEASVLDEGGSLPPGATHEIVGRTESGLPIVRRLRFL